MTDPTFRETLQDIEVLGHRTTPEAADQLGRFLGSSQPALRMAAVEAMGAMTRLVNPPSVLVSHLRSAAEDADMIVRCEAAHALAGLDDADAVEPMVRLLSDEDVTVRAFAAEALGDRAEPAAIEALTHAADDSDQVVRAWACRGIGLVGGTEASPILRSHLVRESEAIPRLEILAALARTDSTGNEAAILIEHLRDADEREAHWLSSIVSDLIETPVPQGVQPLVHALETGLARMKARFPTSFRPSGGRSGSPPKD